jgi:hypothetical protein
MIIDDGVRELISIFFFILYYLVSIASTIFISINIYIYLNIININNNIIS